MKDHSLIRKVGMVYSEGIDLVVEDSCVREEKSLAVNSPGLLRIEDEEVLVVDLVRREAHYEDHHTDFSASADVLPFVEVV
jgi:hypothetical protein